MILAIPEFETLEQYPKPEGTYDLFISNIQIYEGFQSRIKTATVTLARWQLEKGEIKVRKSLSVAKFKVFAEDLEYQTGILRKVVKLLNEIGGQLPRSFPGSISSKSGYKKLSDWLDKTHNILIK